MMPAHVKRMASALVLATWLSPFIVKPVAAEPVLLRDNLITIELLEEDRYDIYIDTADANAFARQEGNTLKLTNPFSKSSEAFTVEVKSQSTGETVFEQTYRKAAPWEIFDSVETSASGQLDGSFISQMKPQPEPEEAFNKASSQNDALADYSLRAARGAFTSTFELEGVHRSNPDDALRYEGPPADISRFEFKNELASKAGTRLYASMGDLELSSRNTLVNTGMTSRGLAVGFETADEKFAFELGRVFGNDIIGAVRGPIGWSADSYRYNATARYRFLENELGSFALTGSFLDVKRSADPNFGLAETPVGETNHTWGLGTEISTLEDRLNLQLHWARSEYDNPQDLNFENLPTDEGFEIFLPGATKGTAWRHELSWDAWSGVFKDKDASIGLELSAERASPFYRSIQGQATSDRKQWSANTNLTFGSINAQIGTTQYRNNLHNLVSIHTLEETLHTAAFSFDLEALRAQEDAEEMAEPGQRSHSLKKLMPSYLDLTLEIEDVRTLNGDVIILAPVIAGLDFMNHTTDTYGVSATWQNLDSSTTLEATYSFFNNDQRERAQADRKDLYYGISHELTKDAWSLGGRVGFSVTDDYDDASRSNTSLAEWGLTGSIRTQTGILFSAEFDDSRNRFKDMVFAELEDSTSKHFSITADIGEWMNKYLKLDSQPSLTATWQKTNSEVDSSYFQSRTSSASTMINAGFTF